MKPSIQSGRIPGAGQTIPSRITKWVSLRTFLGPPNPRGPNTARGRRRRSWLRWRPSDHVAQHRVHQVTVVGLKGCNHVRNIRLHGLLDRLKNPSLVALPIFQEDGESWNPIPRDPRRIRNWDASNSDRLGRTTVGRSPVIRAWVFLDWARVSSTVLIGWFCYRTDSMQSGSIVDVEFRLGEVPRYK